MQEFYDQTLSVFDDKGTRIDQVWFCTFHLDPVLHNPYFKQFADAMKRLHLDEKVLRYDVKRRQFYLGGEGTKIEDSLYVFSNDKKLSADACTHFIPNGCENMVKLTDAYQRVKNGLITF